MREAMGKVLIRGAGDLASGIALRLHHSGFRIVMTELAVPTTVRRTVAFSPAVYLGQARVEDVTGVCCRSFEEAEAAMDQGKVAVMVDETGEIRTRFRPDVVVDAILAKRNLGTRITDAPTVIGVGPGFTAGEDCHCVVETKRGHYLGRCIWEGGAIPDTGVPGVIGGYSTERLIRAGADGIFRGAVQIGDEVKAGDVVGYVVSAGAAAGALSGHAGRAGDIACHVLRAGAIAGALSGHAGRAGDIACHVLRTGAIAGHASEKDWDDRGQGLPVRAQIDGVVRGLLQDGVAVRAGMKAGDVDPRCQVSHCFTVSDKAAAIGGGVLEAIFCHYFMAKTGEV